MTSVSVIIVSWNARESVGQCLAALMPSDHDVIVVDNCSNDGSADYVARSFPAVTLLRAPVNLGYAGAVNLASHRAEGEFLLLLSSGVVANADAIGQLASVIERQPRCGAVTGCLDDGGEACRFPTLWTLALQLLLFDRLRPGARGEVEHRRTACLMVRRAAFEAVGRMDEAFYPAWFEDEDVCRRLRAGGWQILFEPSAHFARLRAGTARRRLGADAATRIWYRNLQRYVRKHYGMAAIVVVQALIVVGMTLRVVLATLTGDRAARRTWRRVLGDVIRPQAYTRLMDQLAAEPSGANTERVL